MWVLCEWVTVGFSAGGCAVANRSDQALSICLRTSMKITGVSLVRGKNKRSIDSLLIDNCMTINQLDRLYFVSVCNFPISIAFFAFSFSSSFMSHFIGTLFQELGMINTKLLFSYRTFLFWQIDVSYVNYCHIRKLSLMRKLSCSQIVLLANYHNRKCHNYKCQISRYANCHKFEHCHVFRISSCLIRVG